MKKRFLLLPLLVGVMVMGAGKAQAAAHAPGTVIRHANGNWLYNDNGTLRWVNGPEVLGTWGYSPSQIVAANSDDNALPTNITSPLYPRAGTFVKQPGDPNIYVIDYASGVAQKRLVTSPSVLFDLGYTVSDIVTPPVNVNLLPGPNGAPLADATTHPNGALVSTHPNSGGDVYLIDNGKQRWVPSTDVLWNLTHHVVPMRRILTATVADRALAYDPHASFLAGTLVRHPGGDLYYIGQGASGPEARYITSVTNLPLAGWPAVTTLNVSVYGTQLPTMGPSL
jgi:hypothetical protein